MVISCVREPADYKCLLLTVRLEDVQAQRDGDATHEHAADPGRMPLTGRRTA
jgi:hypothetical protein